MSRMPIAPGASPSDATAPGNASGSTVADTRARIAGAAFELFAAQGYDGTTVDAVAERAGIARRTFFRYFRSKDDVIFPDHDSLLAAVELRLEASVGRTPIEAICHAVRPVLSGYVDDAQVSVQRYRLTRSVTALRDREIASVRRYERMFSRYVRDRLAPALGVPEAALRADVMAATVVAAHNAVLREWLNAGGGHDPMPRLDDAFRWLATTFGSRPVADGADGEVVVAVFRAGEALQDVVDRISRVL